MFLKKLHLVYQLLMQNKGTHMYKQNKYIILSNEALTDDVYKMVLGGDTQYITAPGQFINIQLDGKFLRRPISVCDYDDESITIIYKVVGEGTQQMKNLVAGHFLDVITGLGNGYDIFADSADISLVGDRNEVSFSCGAVGDFDLAAVVVDGSLDLILHILVGYLRFYCLCGDIFILGEINVLIKVVVIARAFAGARRGCEADKSERQQN